MTSEPKVRKNWTKNHHVKKGAKAVAVSGKRIAGPLLVIVGEEDVIPIGMLRDAVERTCNIRKNRGQSVQLVVYQGVGHFPVIQAVERCGWSGLKSGLAALPTKAA
ncbi:hypothetical protein BDW74DRAFT_180832 [Aspergillus multicolor]|uniref:uncharacterized protein n=1 Tax=Aspergillus multicolor TaxID=41759 RepID=UPI003CCDC9DB